MFCNNTTETVYCGHKQLKYKNVDNTKVLNEVALNSIFGFELYRKKQAFLFSFQTYITRNSLKDVQGFFSFVF